MWSILYSKEWGTIFQCGPFASEELAIAYARKVNMGDGKDPVETEFDIADTRVYIMSPDHRMREMDDSEFQ